MVKFQDHQRITPPSRFFGCRHDNKALNSVEHGNTRAERGGDSAKLDCAATCKLGNRAPRL